MVIPTLFALVVVGQGVYKISKEESDGGIITAIGIIFLVMIVAAYFFFIR